MTGGAAARLRALAHLPRERFLARLGYDLKRPLFALPLYRYSLPGLSATSLSAPPTDPWPGDAEAGARIVRGTFTLAGHSVRDPAPLWAPPGAGAPWRTEMHGFTWLRDLRAAGGDAPRRRARELTHAWLETFGTWHPVAWAPLATGLRLANWLGCYEFFAASAEIEFRHRLLASVAHQARHLARVLPAGLAGAELIGALKGLVCAGAALPDGAPWRARGLALLHREIARQVLPDGGHVERNPARHMAVLRDLIDIRAALCGPQSSDQGAARDELGATIAAMAGWLRMMRLGDGGLGLFNGATEEEAWRMDLILQRAGGPRRPPAAAPESGFHRLSAGRTVVLVDTGALPAPGLDGGAHAGVLSFEVSAGRRRLIVNCGARAHDPAWRRAQRATAAHSTLSVRETNSSDLRAGAGAGRRARMVCNAHDEADGCTWLDAAHDGYARSHGVIHRRRLYLAADGFDLRGEDRLEPTRSRRAGQDFAIRFHLHPAVRASLAQGGDSVLLGLPKGGGWRLHAAGAALALEPSIYLGRAGEIRRTQQVVLRGACAPGGACVKWALRRLDRKRP